jgi:hypothetical protein
MYNIHVLLYMYHMNSDLIAVSSRLTKQVGVEARLQICIHEVLASNLRRDIGYHGNSFPWASSDLPGKCWDST